jgi:transposase-like protein
VVNIQNLIDDFKCFETVRELREPQGVTCPHCDSEAITKQGRDSTQSERQHYQCQSCQKHFDDLTGSPALSVAWPREPRLAVFRTRARRSTNPARPYICRLIVLIAAT